MKRNMSFPPYLPSAVSGVRAVLQTRARPQRELGRQIGVHQWLVHSAHYQRRLHHHRKFHQNWD